MENLDSFTSFKDKTVHFFQTNKKHIVTISSSILILIGGYLYYTISYLPEQEKKAGTALAPLHYYFKNDSMGIVLNGDKSRKIASAKSIADNFSGTNKGKEAALMTAIAYIKDKKYKEAITYLEKTSVEDDILSAAVLNMFGVCYSNLNEAEKAASYFAKAGDKADNEFSAEYYKRAGIHYEISKDYKKALKYYQIIADKYPSTNVGTDINKYVYKMKAELGEYTP
jgi:tetratricopeptide (TPR) repeat protein